MFKKLLITALVIIQLSYGSALVTMSPKLAKIVPTNLPPLRDEYIECFNKYWDIKETIDDQIRQRWNCSNGCPKAEECCMSYKVWDNLKGLKLGTGQLELCDSGAQKMILVFLHLALNQIKERCEPQVEYDSDFCPDMEAKLPALPTSTHSTSTLLASTLPVSTLPASTFPASTLPKSTSNFGNSTYPFPTSTLTLSTSTLSTSTSTLPNSTSTQAIDSHDFNTTYSSNITLKL